VGASDLERPERADVLERANRIGGEPREALSGASFERPARAWPWLGASRWPRSLAEDAELALDAAAAAAPSWRALGRAGRLERLLAACAALERGPALGILAEGLGLAPAELAPRHEEELHRWREALEILREAPDAPPVSTNGALPDAFLAHWSDLAAGLGLRISGRLADGHAAILWSDPRLPEGAALLVQALEQGGVPAGAVGLLHDDLGASARFALAEARVGWVRIKGTRLELARFDSLPSERSLWPTAPSTELVLGGEDPTERAGELVRKALGRSDTLSGQWPGQVGRIICHQRLFSRFSEEFLHGLEAASERPAPAIDADLPAYVRRAWALGIDEGATPIFGGDPLVRAAEPPPGATSSAEGTAQGRAPRAVPPVVFTNVEAHQRLARLGRPAPITILLRASSDEGAREQAAELERSGADPIQDPTQSTRAR
jgi:hypothetical protein